MGFDPLQQSDTYEADALPPSHHGWTKLAYYLFPKKDNVSIRKTMLEIIPSLNDFFKQFIQNWFSDS